jgi:hypothetical protein
MLQLWHCLDLLTNATVVDDAIRFVSQSKEKENLKSSTNSNEDDLEESNEPDYDEDEKSDKATEEEQEEETAEIDQTINQVF